MIQTTRDRNNPLTLSRIPSTYIHGQTHVLAGAEGVVEVADEREPGQCGEVGQILNTRVAQATHSKPVRVGAGELAHDGSLVHADARPLRVDDLDGNARPVRQKRVLQGQV